MVFNGQQTFLAVVPIVYMNIVYMDAEYYESISVSVESAYYTEPTIIFHSWFGIFELFRKR